MFVEGDFMLGVHELAHGGLIAQVADFGLDFGCGVQQRNELHGGVPDTEIKGLGELSEYVPFPA
jgi:hypothetical protein